MVELVARIGSTEAQVVVYVRLDWHTGPLWRALGNITHRDATVTYFVLYTVRDKEVGFSSRNIGLFW